jgi:hypothetical protein
MSDELKLEKRRQYHREYYHRNKQRLLLLKLSYQLKDEANKLIRAKKKKKQELKLEDIQKKLDEENMNKPKFKVTYKKVKVYFD